MANEQKSRVITPVGRVTFPWVFRPQPAREGFSSADMYQVTLVFEPELFSPEEKKRFNELVRIADEASVAKFKRKIKELPANFKKPFRDGMEKEHLDGYGEGKIFSTFKSKFRPGIVASDGRTPIEDPEAFYSGCYARVSATAFAYDNKGKGVSFWMQNVMFVKDGERLDGRVDAADDFGDFGDAEQPNDFSDLM